jgi:hypothetical protein
MVAIKGGLHRLLVCFNRNLSGRQLLKLVNQIVYPAVKRELLVVIFTGNEVVGQFEIRVEILNR